MRPYQGNQDEEDPDIKKIKKVNFHMLGLDGEEDKFTCPYFYSFLELNYCVKMFNSSQNLILKLQQTCLSFVKCYFMKQPCVIKS